MATSLAAKLQMKPGQRALLINAPSGYREQLQPLPDAVEVTEEPEGEFDFVQAFVKDSGELERYLPEAKSAVKHDALLWICYPKGGAKNTRSLERSATSSRGIAAPSSHDFLKMPAGTASRTRSTAASYASRSTGYRLRRFPR